MKQCQTLRPGARFRLPLTVFCSLLIGPAASPPPAIAAEPPTAQSRLLAEHGIRPDAVSLIAYLRRLQPDPQRQAEIAMLVQQLSAGRFATREAASRKLSAFGEAARPQLEAALLSEDAEVRFRARQVLAELDSDDQRRLRDSLNLAVLRVLKSGRDPQAARTILAVIPVLTETSVRNAACEALWACTSPDHAGALFEALDGDDAAQRAAALVALEVAGGADHVQAIAGQLDSQDALLRLAAARALIDRRPRAAIESLIPLTDDEDQEIAWQADALLQLKTGRLLELSGKQTLGEAWRAWAQRHLASAGLEEHLGARRLDLSAGRHQLEETFARSQATLKDGYGRFSYTADNGGRAKVADGVLRIRGGGAEGDQRLLITSQRMLGRDRWPDRLVVATNLAGEHGNNYGWHLGVSVGRIKVLFHPGVDEGAFRAETTDDHQALFSNENMGFDVATGKMYKMTLRVVRTDQGADFEATFEDEKGGHSYRRRFRVTHEQLGEFNRIGLERSGRTGADALFDSVAIRLGR